MKIHKDIEGVEYWYDRSTKCWWTARYDNESNQNQIGSVYNAYTKGEIIAIAKSIAPKFGWYVRKQLDNGDVITRETKVKILRTSTSSYYVEFMTGPNKGWQKPVKKSKVELIDD